MWACTVLVLVESYNKEKWKNEIKKKEEEQWREDGKRRHQSTLELQIWCSCTWDTPIWFIRLRSRIWTQIIFASVPLSNAILPKNQLIVWETICVRTYFSSDCFQSVLQKRTTDSIERTCFSDPHKQLLLILNTIGSGTPFLRAWFEVHKFSWLKTNG